MSDKFKDILKKQEKEDDFAHESEAFIIEKFKREYANADQLIDYVVNTLKLSSIDGITEAFNAGNHSFMGGITLVRHESEYKIRKHTTVQVPYTHSHDFYELIFVLKGCCHQTIGIEETPADVMANQACLVMPNTIHRLDRIQGDEIIFKMHIPQDVFKACYPTTCDTSRQYITYMDTTEQAKLYVVKLLDEYHNKNAFSDIAINNYLSLLFVELIRGKIAYQNAIITDLNQYLLDNYRTASLIDFSQIVGYNAVYVGKIIKQETGKSFSTILTAYKLKEAVARLTNTDMSIADISAEVGYTNSTGLYKSFYKEYGMTPAEYRKSIRD